MPAWPPHHLARSSERHLSPQPGSQTHVHRRCGWSVDHLNPAGTGFWARPSRGAGRVAVIDDDSRPGTLHRIGVPRRRGRCWSESIASSDEGWGTPRPATAPPSSRRGSRPRTPHRSRRTGHERVFTPLRASVPAERRQRRSRFAQLPGVCTRDPVPVNAALTTDPPTSWTASSWLTTGEGAPWKGR